MLATAMANDFDSPFVSNFVFFGSGDYFGPLTVCAAFVTKEHVPILKTLGVDDSKKLTDTKIVELAEQLVAFIPHSLLT
ncbi:hypothetical protein APW74_09320, partial [Staphylococcus aureus]